MPSEPGPLRPRYQELRFCPRCGARYGAQDFHARDVVFLCRDCGFDFYQNPLPAAVVAATHAQRPGEVLLIRRRTPPGVGAWCLPGGFIRYGEVPELAAAREMREESGVDVDIGRVLRVSMFDYIYHGRSLCILELAFEGQVRGSIPASDTQSSEATEILFFRKEHFLRRVDLLAFPTQAEVLRAL